MTTLRTANRTRRVEMFGRLGSYLDTIVEKDCPRVWSYDNFDLQVVTISELGNSPNTLIVAAAMSLLLSKHIVQVTPDKALVLRLFEESIKRLPPNSQHSLNCACKRWVSPGDVSKDFVKLKPHTAAANKTNLYFSEAIAGAYQFKRAVATDLYQLRHHIAGMTDDQAAATVLYACGLEQHFPQPAEMAVRLVLDTDGAKILSTALKSLGQNATIYGAVLCEANTLYGRGATALDLRSESMERIDPVLAHKKTPELFSEDELRASIRSILADELNISEAPEFEDVDRFWERRWLWCVNGGHSRALERHEPKWAVSYAGRIHRRVAMEHWTINPLKEWSGNVYVSASEKLEHGKNRLLLACDTVSYVCFEHLLSTVEKLWKGKRVVLDPGGGGRIGMSRRVRNMGASSLYVMLDYDDFNSQHTLLAQKIAVEEVCRLTGYDPHLTDKLVGSFDRMLIHAGSETLGYAKSTLMSGHRATTFLNSVLNAAYIRAAAPDAWGKMKSIHIGDDVVVACSGYAEADTLLDALGRTGIKMNPTKQSTGQYCAELLRMAVTEHYTHGYYARSVASTVSGNWTSDNELSPEDRIRTIITSARSLINRCYSDTPALVISSAVAKRTGTSAREIRELLTGEATLGPGPTFSLGPIIHEFELERLVTSEEDFREKENLPAAATTDYLSNAATDVERTAMTLAGASIREPMVHASYQKSLGPVESLDVRLKMKYRLRRVKAQAYHGWVYDQDVAITRRNPGALGRYPLLHLLRSRLSEKAVSSLLEMVGVTAYRDREEAAWGTDAHGVRIVGSLPYSDAAALCSCTMSGVIYVTHPIYM